MSWWSRKPKEPNGVLRRHRDAKGTEAYEVRMDDAVWYVLNFTANSEWTAPVTLDGRCAVGDLAKRIRNAAFAYVQEAELTRLLARNERTQPTVEQLAEFTVHVREVMRGKGDEA